MLLLVLSIQITFVLSYQYTYTSITLFKFIKNVFTKILFKSNEDIDLNVKNSTEKKQMFFNHMNKK